MVCTSGKTSYNVLSHSPVTKLGPGSTYAYQRGGGGGEGVASYLVIDFQGVIAKERVSRF